jgi:hypothetical protein
MAPPAHAGSAISGKDNSFQCVARTIPDPIRAVRNSFVTLRIWQQIERLVGMEYVCAYQHR